MKIKTIMLSYHTKYSIQRICMYEDIYFQIFPGQYNGRAFSDQLKIKLDWIKISWT